MSCKTCKTCKHWQSASRAADQWGTCKCPDITALVSVDVLYPFADFGCVLHEHTPEAAAAELVERDALSRQAGLEPEEFG